VTWKFSSQKEYVVSSFLTIISHLGPTHLQQVLASQFCGWDHPIYSSLSMCIFIPTGIMQNQASMICMNIKLVAVKATLHEDSYDQQAEMFVKRLFAAFGCSKICTMHYRGPLLMLSLTIQAAQRAFCTSCTSMQHTG